MTYNVPDMLQRARVVKPAKDGEPLKSTLVNPMTRYMYRSSRAVLESNKGISYRILRTVAERAWIINAIIAHYIRNIRPFLKPSTDKNIRGFRVTFKDAEHEMTANEKKLAGVYEQFFMKTGFGDDPDREDDLGQYCAKIIRDALTLDQIATEVQRTVAKKVYAFWAVDGATIIRTAEEGYNGNDEVKFIQEIDMVTTAMYTRDDLVFEFMNPRTDIDHAGYGYSMVEQAVDLVTGLINSYMYNMGFFTEDKLPRGMLLLQGDADTEEVEMIEDYLVDIMSGGPVAKWHIPIIPAGRNPTPDGTGGNEGRKFEWVSLQGSNKDMEFSQWTEFLWSSVTAIFGVDLEEMGIRTSKSTAIIGQNTAPRLEASKSRGLGFMLGFLQGHLQKILDKVDPRYQLEFLGYEKDDPMQKMQIRESQLRTSKTIDELRVEDGDEPFEQPWSKIPLNPYVVQMSQGAAAMGGGGMQAPQGGDSGYGEPGNTESAFDLKDFETNQDVGQSEEQNKRGVEKSLSNDDVIEISV